MTIFSCTWVAVHPNVPCPKNQNPVISFVGHRLPLFICALLVPEYVLAWAIRQFLRAREIANRDKGEFKTFGYIFITLSNLLLERQWLTTHGFFMIMGGFHLFERSLKETGKDNRNISQEDDKPLHPLQADDLVDCDGYESFIMPTKAEIKDKGKSDWLAKSLVLLQTSWFVMQCIARAREHLPVTHLEIITLAYAAMNFVTYIFWWNKPLNVNRPVRVFRKSDPNAASDGNQPRRSGPTERELTLKTMGKGLETLLMLIVAGENNVDLSREDRVPRFWADDHSGDHFIPADFVVLGVGVCFGAIHCIAWHFSFPTHTELLMWQISSVAITAVPVYTPLMFGLGVLLGGVMEFDKSGIAVLFFGPLSGGILYIIARAVTLVLAFTSLRDLPPGSYDTIHWTTFIPHI